jgi:hypothetical protein
VTKSYNSYASPSIDCVYIHTPTPRFRTRHTTNYSTTTSNDFAMSSPSFHPVAIILGAGANIGANAARVFANSGYRVALAARKLQNEQPEADRLHIQADFANPSTINAAFDSVEKAFGPANVIIYNGAPAFVALTICQQLTPLPKLRPPSSSRHRTRWSLPWMISSMTWR